MLLIRPLTIVDAILTSSNVPETDYPAYNAGTSYAVGDYVIVVAPNVHQVYQSLVAGNLGHTPATSPTQWLFIGATNRWKMFDQSMTSQTSNPNTIDCVFSAVGRVDSVACFNLNAYSVEVKVTDPVTSALVYDKTKTLISPSGIFDWWTYFFEPIVRVNDVAFTDLPPYNNAIVEVIIADPAATPVCGACVLGLSKNIGGTQYGSGVGIQDYSVKQQDAFGNYTIQPRAFSKNANLIVWIPASEVDNLEALMEQYRATPIVYLGSDLYLSTMIYGYYKDFNIVIQYMERSVCTIDVEGLT